MGAHKAQSKQPQPPRHSCEQASTLGHSLNGLPRSVQSEAEFEVVQPQRSIVEASLAQASGNFVQLLYVLSHLPAYPEMNTLCFVQSTGFDGRGDCHCSLALLSDSSSGGLTGTPAWLTRGAQRCKLDDGLQAGVACGTLASQSSELRYCHAPFADGQSRSAPETRCVSHAQWVVAMTQQPAKRYTAPGPSLTFFCTSLGPHHWAPGYLHGLAWTLQPAQYRHRHACSRTMRQTENW